MASLLLDTDVVVDSLRGASRLVFTDEPVSYSVVTLCELFAGTATDEDVIRALLSDCVLLDIDRGIAEQAGRIRRVSGIKTPDALIAATALVHRLTLVTRNRRDFGRVDGLSLRDPTNLASP